MTTETIHKILDVRLVDGVLQKLVHIEQTITDDSGAITGYARSDEWRVVDSLSQAEVDAALAAEKAANDAADQAYLTVLRAMLVAVEAVAVPAPDVSQASPMLAGKTSLDQADTGSSGSPSIPATMNQKTLPDGRVFIEDPTTDLGWRRVRPIPAPES